MSELDDSQGGETGAILGASIGGYVGFIIPFLTMGNSLSAAWTAAGTAVAGLVGGCFIGHYCEKTLRWTFARARVAETTQASAPLGQTKSPVI